MTFAGGDGADGRGRLAALVSGAVTALRERGGRGPDAVWAAPGRVNLIGEHTDYSGGFVLPVAIDRHTVAAAARRDDGRLRCWSLQADTHVEMPVAAIAPGTVKGWGAYAAGAAWALGRERGEAGGGADVVVNGDVPLGAGLSSSAALACAVTGALAGLAGQALAPRVLARVARSAEIEIAGMPCGVMDQLASVLGRADHAVFIDTRSLEVAHIPLDLASAGLQLLVVETRAPHRLVEGHYAERRAACEEAARALGVPELRDASRELVAETEAAGRLDPLLARRARHVVSENARVLATVELLRSGQPDRLGEPLGASHASLRDDFEVSSPELDLAVEVARDAGAVGARMTGAGFGGSAIALTPIGLAEQVEKALLTAFARRRFRAPRIFQVGIGDGAHEVLDFPRG
jgi:galactokinase